MRTAALARTPAEAEQRVPTIEAAQGPMPTIEAALVQMHTEAREQMRTAVQVRTTVVAPTMPAIEAARITGQPDVTNRREAAPFR
jgi:hypothetical protein